MSLALSLITLFTLRVGFGTVTSEPMNKHGADRSLKLPAQVFVFLFVVATVLGLAQSVAWYAELTSQGTPASFTNELL